MLFPLSRHWRMANFLCRPDGSRRRVTVQWVGKIFKANHINGGRIRALNPMTNIWHFEYIFYRRIWGSRRAVQERRNDPLFSVPERWPHEAEWSPVSEFGYSPSTVQFTIPNDRRFLPPNKLLSLKGQEPTFLQADSPMRNSSFWPNHYTVKPRLLRSEITWVGVKASNRGRDQILAHIAVGIEDNTNPGKW